MHLSGQTPLFKAKNLEKHLGLSDIYLKLEGANPTGHKNDRIAEALVKFLQSKGYEKALVHGSENYLRSMIYFCNYYNIVVYALKSQTSLGLQKTFPDIQWITLKQAKNVDQLDVLESYASTHNMYLLSEWEKKPFVRSIALQSMIEEAIIKLNNVTGIFTQGRGGYTLRATYHGLMRGWVNGIIEKMPTIHCGLKTIVDKELYAPLEDSIDATNAHTYEISEPELREAVKLIKRLENISISKNEAYALCALINYAKEVREENGAYIVFLNDGKSDIDITEVSKRKDLDIQEILTTTRKLLEPYTDSVEETLDAIKKAIDVGYIFLATRRGEIQGICIVVHMGFEDFIPSYHLAYIGVKKGNSGRGLATELMNAAIDKTGGNLSLHVDIPNRRAKKLYEKMGFVHKYDRMLYKG
jgi:threonine synthase